MLYRPILLFLDNIRGLLLRRCCLFRLLQLLLLQTWFLLFLWRLLLLLLLDHSTTSRHLICSKLQLMFKRMVLPLVLGMLALHPGPTTAHLRRCLLPGRQRVL